jgi:hypothetical protein
MLTMQFMQTLPLRDLQQRGSKAVPDTHDPVILTGRQGPLYLLVPVDPAHLADQEREIRRALARANLRAWQEQAVDAGLDTLTDADIEAEIAAARKAGKRSKRRSTRSA